MPRELLHRQRADPRRRDLARRRPSAARPRSRRPRPRRAPSGDRPAGQRLAQAGDELVAVELLARPVALDDDEPGGLDPLVGREPGRAGGALAATADGRGIVEVARVDDAGLPLAALGAAHRSPARLAPLGLVVSTEDTTTWCGVAGRRRGGPAAGQRAPRPALRPRRASAIALERRGGRSPRGRG